MGNLPDLAELVSVVEDRVVARDPLRRIEAAEEIATELSKLADRLVGYFIEQARIDGHSWTNIGDRFGISRQAAQQRYMLHRSSLTLADLAAAGALSRLTERTRAALSRAEKNSRTRHAGAVEPVDVLVSILANADTLAAKVVQRLGVRRTAVLGAAKRTAPESGTSVPVSLPFSAAARRVLDAAVGEALKFGHNYVGTEHLLLGLLHLDRDPASRILTDHGIHLDATRDAVRAEIDAFLKRRG